MVQPGSLAVQLRRDDTPWELRKAEGLCRREGLVQVTEGFAT